MNEQGVTSVLLFGGSRMRNIWIWVFIIALFMIGEFIRRTSLNKLLKAIYEAAYINKDEEAFHLLVVSPQAKMLMSDATRLIMQLNFYVANDQEEKVVKIVEKMKKIRLNKNNQKAFYSTAIGYYAEKERTDTLDLINHMKKAIENTQDGELQMLLYDCQLTYDIYVKKDISKIHELQQLLETDIDANAKSVYQYRLAKLYKIANNMDRCQEMLKLAYKNTASKQAKKKIDRILDGEMELL